MHNEPIHLEYDSIQIWNDDNVVNEAINEGDISKTQNWDKSSIQNLNGYNTEIDWSIRHLFYLEYRWK